MSGGTLDAFPAGSYTLFPVADNGELFEDFGPYVASISDSGVVAFQATSKGGGSGVFTAAGGSVSAVLDPSTGPVSDAWSHPDVNRDGSTCFYGTLRSGRRAVILVRDGQLITVADATGPRGPTINDRGLVAYQVESDEGRSGLFTGGGREISRIAETGGDFSGFHGLPVINRDGSVVFRADRTAGGQGIYVGDGRRLIAIAETGDRFADLGRFPILNDLGTVAFCATLRDGRSGVFTWSEGATATVIDSSGAFESFRGVLLNNPGRIVFYATPRGGRLGIFSGPDPVTDCLLSLGAPLFGSALVDFALNPVSINNSGQIAVRVVLADKRHLVLRADPAT